MTALEENIARMSLEELRVAYRNELLDWAETDTYVKEIAARVLSPKEIDGDGYAFQSVEDIVDILVKRML